MRTRQATTDEPIRQTPSTVVGWRERVGELEREADEAQRVLNDKRGKRREAAGAALVFGANPEAVFRLEAEEREAERRLDSLRCGVELARTALKRLEVQEKKRNLDERRARREAVAARIQEEAQSVDRFYQEVASHLETINGLLISYQMEGGSFARSLKGCSTRAALAAGLRPYLETGFVGSNEHIRPLAEQLSGLAVARVPEDWLVENPPAA
jgi:hypothetical protein